MTGFGTSVIKVRPALFVTYGHATVLDYAFTQLKAFVAIHQSESSKHFER